MYVVLVVVVLLSNLSDVMSAQSLLKDRRNVMKGGTSGGNRVVAAMATWEFGTLAVEECVALLQQEGANVTHPSIITNPPLLFTYLKCPRRILSRKASNPNSNPIPNPPLLSTDIKVCPRWMRWSKASTGSN